MRGLKKRTAVLFFLLVLLLPGSSLFGQNNTGRRGDDLTLKVAIIGPGDELYFWWGHIGLVVEDRYSGQVRFFDWGVFSFENENFFVNFAFGRLIYSCAVSRAEQNYKVYTRTNRDITLYTLDLPAESKEAILRFAEINMLPENRDYWYHHFRDNCATRIRDILDIGVNGQFKVAFENAPGRFTLRQHVRRHTWFNPVIDWALNFWMGQGIDRPITVWDDMFLPSEIAGRIREFHYVDSDGTKRALVSSVEILNTSRGRPMVLDVPRLQWPRELLASILFSGLLLLLFLFYRNKKGFKVFLGILHSVLGFIFGSMGSVLFFMTFFTNHDYTYHNSNIFFVNPLFYAAVPLGLIYGLSKNAKRRFVAVRLLKLLWTCVLLGGLLTMAIKLSPAFYQQNQVTQALVLPLAVTMVFIMIRMGRKRSAD